MRGGHIALSLAAATLSLAAPSVTRAEDDVREAAPPVLSASSVTDLFANVDGGVDRGVVLMEKADLYLDTTLSVIGLDRVTAHADLQLLFGGSLNTLVGDAQVSSNVDAPSGLRPLEAWLAAPLGARTTIKAGLIDLNGDFDVQEVGGVFINSSHGIGPDFSQTGLNGPSIFPTTSAGVVARHDGDRLSVRFGAFDAVSGDPERLRRTVIRFPGQSGLLLVAEADRAMGEGAKVQLGAWTYTSRFEALEAAKPVRANNQGAYGLIEGRLARVNGRELKTWMRAGVANDAINPIGLYLGGGAVLESGGDALGLAVAHARLGDAAIRTGVIDGPIPDRAETTFELTYSRPLTTRFTLQPDFQYTINPCWDPTVRNATVIGLRVSATYP